MHCVAVLCAMLNQSKAAISLGHLKAAAILMERGLPQGAPESPLLFTLVTEAVLRPLIHKWKQDGFCWNFDGFSLCAVCYADDIILISSRKADLTRMLSAVISSFSDVGLEVSTDKCHWTCWPTQHDSTLLFGGDLIKWESSLTFVGTILDVGGNDEAAINYRLAQATKVFFKWQGVLQCSSASVSSRAALFLRTSMMALLWLAETWHPTQRQRQRLRSWGARMMARVVRVRRMADEGIGDFWRRLHRVGSAWLRRLDGAVNTLRRRRLHSFAGHLARASDDPAGRALRTRSLAWWRYFQGRRLLKHPARFGVWRWEAQLEEHYGQATSLFIDEDVGWMRLAQDRAQWRELQDAFARGG